jgi:2-polyprenyl-3-methyl-5-hydroxy-6-metoxy-1,4-benzoquinol methylase
MLRCIACRGILESTDSGYTCRSCKKRYPNEDGIIRFRDETPVKEYHFPEGGFDVLYRSEAGSFWFQVRNRIIGALLSRYVPKDARLLEVGCGTGFVAGYLNQQGYQIECADLFLEGLNYCRKRGSGYAYYQYDLYDQVFSEEFDGVLACDVIEHLEDDARVLTNLNRSLKKGGVLMLTVPACPAIWSDIDEYAGHKRRYSRDEVKRKLEAAGFRVLKSSYFMMLLFPAIALSRMRMRLPETAGDAQKEILVERATGELSLPPVLNSLFGRIFALEVPIISHMDLPIGSSLVAVAVKEGSP